MKFSAFFLPVFVFTFLFALPVFAYSDQTTHPALTDEIVAFYNLTHQDNQIPTDFLLEIRQGSIDEDTAPRWFNHFYDPIYNAG